MTVDNDTGYGGAKGAVLLHGRARPRAGTIFLWQGTRRRRRRLSLNLLKKILPEEP